jgi:hypothetical protein
MATLNKKPITAAIREQVKKGAILAIPKQGETSEQAIARVQKRHPGKKVIDPPQYVVNELNAEADAIRSVKENNIPYYAALNRMEGYGKFVRNGARLLPKPIMVDNSVRLNEGWQFTDTAIGSVPEEWDCNYGLARLKMDKGNVDRKFSIFKYRKQNVDSVYNIGRMWTSTFPGKYQVIERLSSSATLLKMEPAFAGMSGERFDNTMSKAIQALPNAFHNTRSEDFSPTARHALRHLIEIPFDATRLLVRMAVLWFAASIIEEKNGMLQVTGAHERPRVLTVTEGAAFNELLTLSSAENAQVLYTEMHKAGNDPEILEVYYAAMSAGNGYRALGLERKDLPTILKLWPEINNAVLAMLGARETILSYSTLSARAIWCAIEVYVVQMKLHEQWKEVFEAVSAMVWRPEGDSAFCGHQAVQMALPRSQMQAAALGPTLMMMRHWEEYGNDIKQPLLPEIAWRGTSRYMIWALLYRDMVAQAGGAELRIIANAADFVKRCEWLVYSRGPQNPLNVSIEIVAKEFGWNNLLGNILRTVQGMSRASYGNQMPLGINVPIKSKMMLQWEEALNCTTMLPEGCYALSLLYPAKPLGIPVECTWLQPRQVFNRYGITDAVYSLIEAGVKSVGYLSTNSYTATCKVRKASILKSYRDRPRDSQFFLTAQEDGTKTGPVCWLEDLESTVKVFGSANRNAEADWYITQAYDLSDEGLMSYFEKIDTHFPMMWDITLGMAKAESESEEPEESEESAQQEESSTQEEDVPAADTRVDAEHTQYIAAKKRISKTLKTEPGWLSIIDPLMTSSATALHSGELSQPAARAYAAIIRDNPIRLAYEEYENPEDVPNLMEDLDLIIGLVARHHRYGSDRLKLYRMQQAARSVGTCYKATGGMITAKRYIQLSGKALPSYVTPEVFEELVASGVPIADITEATSEETFLQMLEEVRAETAALLAEHEKQQEAEQLDPAEASGSTFQTEIEEVPIMETRPEVALIQPDPDQGGNFGGEAASLAAGDGDPATRQQSDASAAPRTSPRVTAMDFAVQPQPDAS